jgi:hypothetical protein
MIYECGQMHRPIARLVFARTAVALAVGLIAAPLSAQSPDGGPVRGWAQQLTDLEARVKAPYADDRAGLDRTAAALHELDLQVSNWLTDRGLTIEAPPAESPRPPDLTVELSRVRALIAQARAGSVDDPEGAGVFYLGRVDVAVTAEAPSPGSRRLMPAISDCWRQRPSTRLLKLRRA